MGLFDAMLASAPAATPPARGLLAAAKARPPSDEDAQWRAQMADRLRRNAPYAKPGAFTTALPPDQEKAFRAWVTANRVPFNPDDDITDYDMRGYWAARQHGHAEGTQVNPNDGRPHYPDTFKTPYHQSFSAESQYALPSAPVWINNHQLADPKTGRVVFDELAPITKGMPK